MSSPTPTLRTRKPTGAVPWPLILIEGGEKAGKSWACAELSASPRVGQTYWIDLGEGVADAYGAIPGANYLIVEHDGTFAALLGAVEAVRAEAVRAAAAGEPPVVLIVDSMTNEWETLKAVVDKMARNRLARKGKHLAADQEPQIGMDLWNLANGWHRRLMTHLMTFPGIVVMTARGKEIAALDSSGRPIEGSREYKVEGQKNLAFDSTVWVRVSRDHPPLIVGAWSVHAGVRHGVERPRPAPGLTLEKVVFDFLQCDPATARVRNVEPIKTADPDVVMVTSEQNRIMHALWNEIGYGGEENRTNRLTVIAKVVGLEELESSAMLTVQQADVVIAALRAKKQHMERTAQQETEPQAVAA